MPKSYALKRPLDFCLAVIGLFFSFPLWVLFIFLIWIEDYGPVFYIQERVGWNGKIFKSIKFRSMKPEAEKGMGPIQAKENDPRITNIGRFLRKTALDELPQLINIFKGEMSFVGPRALRPTEKGNCDNITKSVFDFPEFKVRSRVKPGLTGTAQVFTSRNLAYEGKFKYDLWYIDNTSCWLDIKLIARSILITFNASWDS